MATMDIFGRLSEIECMLQNGMINEVAIVDMSGSDRVNMEVSSTKQA